MSKVHILVIQGVLEFQKSQKSKLLGTARPIFSKLQ